MCRHSIVIADIQKKIDTANNELLALFPAYNNGYSVNAKTAFVLIKENGKYRIDFFFPDGSGFHVVTSGTKKQCHDSFNPSMAAKKMYERFCCRTETYGNITYSRRGVRFIH